MTSPVADASRLHANTNPAADALPANANVNAAASMPGVTTVAARNSFIPAANAAVLPPAQPPQFAPPAHSTAPSPAFDLFPTIPAEDIRFDTPSPVGMGATAAVFRGRWGQEPVALKHLAVYYLDEHGRKQVVEYDDDGEALQWEASRLASVDHPNVVQFHGLCHRQGKTYLVMEWCGHGDLEDALKKGGLGNARLWQWMLEISAGLAHLHGQGMLHRDLKAANVLIDAHGRAKLGDLGVAQVDALLQNTELDAVKGGMQTPGIMAPEIQRMGKGHFNTRATDVYALGLLFWRMAHQGAAHDADRPLAIADTCAPQFRDLILACCDPNPHRRATMDEVQRRLQRMGPELHPDHALVDLATHLQHELHDKRDAARRYVPSQVTARPVDMAIDQYWQFTDASVSAPTDTGQVALATSSTASASSASSTSSTTTQAPIDAAARSMALANPPLSLQHEIDAFLETPGSGALLLLGDGGVGKSLSIHVLAERLLRDWWRHWADPTHPRPPCLPLLLRSHVTRWSDAEFADAYATILSRHALEPQQAPLLVIVDGYDECSRDGEATPNLAAALGLPPGAKLLVTCRPDAVPEAERLARFGLVGQLRGRHFLPFHAEQSLAYLQQQLKWDEPTRQRYAQTLRESPPLRAILGNPFMLHLLAQSWESVKHAPLAQLTRSRIHAAYIAHAVTAGAALLAPQVQAQLRAGHADLAASYLAFLRRVAMQACGQRGMTLSADQAGAIGMGWAELDALVEQAARQQYWERDRQQARLSVQEKRERQRRMVFTQEDFVGLKRQAARKLAASLPLQQRAGRFEFIHQSLFEYCAAQQLLRLMKEEAESVDENSLNRLLRLINDAFPESLLLVAETMDATARQGHASAVENASQLRIEREQRNEACLLDAIGLVLNDRGLQYKALEYHHKALAIRQKVLGNDHVDTATSYNNIASALHDQGQHAQALEYHHKALAIKEEVLGNDHVDTAASYNNIATVLHTQGQHSQALEYLHKALAIREKVLGNDHVTTAASYNNIASVLHAQGQHAQALEYLHRALAIWERVLGNDHVDTAASYNNIASVLHDQGQHAQALEYHHKALAIWEKVLGNGHVTIASSYNNIARALHDQGQHAQALEYLHKALAIREKVLGIDHVDTAMSYNNTASVFQALGQHAQAEEYRRKAEAVLERHQAAQ